MDYIDIKNNKNLIRFEWIIIYRLFCKFIDTDHIMTI